jgi:energy-coupling factor transport system ATP-binding protein
MALIEISDVTFTYGVQPDEEAALSEVSLKIEAGSFVGVTGPSDAGKSTLGRLIASYIPNYFDGRLEGTATVDGYDVTETEIAEISDTVGLLFENPFDQLTGASNTVFEEVAFGLENKGVPRSESIDTTTEKLRLTGIENLYDRNPQELSGGQSQRVALASMLAMEPEIMIFDEPTSQLDPHGTEEVMSVIASLVDEGYTVVIVSHDLDRLARHLDRLVVFDEGRVVEDGRPQELFRDADRDAPYELPDAATVGKRLRALGKVATDESLPLTFDDIVAEVAPHVTDEATASPGLSVESNDANSTVGSSAAIQFDRTHFFYEEDVHALRGLTLDLESGCVCVIGQNGAGKSTFLKHLNGLLTPSEGRVTVNGKDTDNHQIAELAGEAALSFQNPDNQLFHSTVEAEVRYGPQNLGYPEERIEALAEAAIDRMNLTDLRQRNPYDVGLARRKHVAIASVLAMDTPLVALDEPTGSQDALGIRLLGDVIDRLVEEGKLVVVITHDVEFVRNHADRVVALGGGEVLLDGDAREVFGREAVLAETDVEPPFVTRLATRLGLPGTVLTVDELFKHIE